MKKLKNKKTVGWEIVMMTGIILLGIILGISCFNLKQVKEQQIKLEKRIDGLTVQQADYRNIDYKKK